jgi:phage terminase large subunit-like protein
VKGGLAMTVIEVDGATLSNTATPKYFAEFRDKVQRGEIPVSREILMEFERIEALVASPNVWYDPAPTEGFILFCETEMTLTDGNKLEMLPSFRIWAEQVLCWYYFETKDVPDPEFGGFVTKEVKLRLINKQYLIVARGAAKSLYETCFQAYFLCCDTDTTHQITTAPTMKLAEEIMGPFRTAIIRAPGPLFKLLTMGSLQNTTGNRALRQKLVATKKGIENFLTSSLLEVRPMSIDKLQSLRSKCNTVDEWLSGDVREDVVGALEQGASKVDDWLILAVSSEGTVRNGAGDTIKLELADILKGEYTNPHVSIWHYKLDELEEVNDERMWVKAQPNLGKTVSYATYRQDKERAEKAPATRNDILAKRFGLPREGYTYFFAYDDTVPHHRREFWGLPCALGADMSMGDDFCAFTFLFPLRGDKFGIKARSYISKLSYDKLPGAMRNKYDEFRREGSLHVLDGTILDLDGEVFDDLEAFIEKSEFEVRAFGYDTYGATAFANRWATMNGEYAMHKVIQGARTESIPLGEIKKLAEERLLIFDQEIMRFCMGNAVTVEDTNGNRKLHKQRHDQKIDNVSALLDGFVAFKLEKEQFE